MSVETAPQSGEWLGTGGQLLVNGRLGAPQSGGDTWSPSPTTSSLCCGGAATSPEHLVPAPEHYQVPVDSGDMFPLVTRREGGSRLRTTEECYLRGSNP
jgi:hypothetical protein